MVVVRMSLKERIANFWRDELSLLKVLILIYAIIVVAIVVYMMY